MNLLEALKIAKNGLKVAIPDSHYYILGNPNSDEFSLYDKERDIFIKRLDIDWQVISSKNWVEYGRPSLSEAEFIILSNLDSCYNWICRDANGIFISENKPYLTYGNLWSVDGGETGELSIFDHLFGCVPSHSVTPLNIKEALENYRKK